MNGNYSYHLWTMTIFEECPTKQIFLKFLRQNGKNNRSNLNFMQCSINQYNVTLLHTTGHLDQQIYIVSHKRLKLTEIKL